MVHFCDLTSPEGKDKNALATGDFELHLPSSLNQNPTGQFSILCVPFPNEQEQGWCHVSMSFTSQTFTMKNPLFQSVRIPRAGAKASRIHTETSHGYRASRPNTPRPHLVRGLVPLSLRRIRFLGSTYWILSSSQN